LKKENYGKVPEYLVEHRRKIESEYNLIREMKEQKERDEKKMLLSEDEANLLRAGLTKKLELLKNAYSSYTHKAKLDTIKQKTKKELLEKEMQIIEKDISKLNKKNIYIDMERV
jgi:hypothetical protein